MMEKPLVLLILTILKINIMTKNEEIERILIKYRYALTGRDDLLKLDEHIGFKEAAEDINKLINHEMDYNNDNNK